MSPMLRLQIIAIGATTFLCVSMMFVIPPAMPKSDFVIYAASLGVLVLGWGGSVAWIRLRGLIRDDTPDGWFRHNVASFWLANITTSVIFWVSAPYLTPESILLGLNFMMVGNLTQAVATVRSPGHGPRGLAADLAPLAMPVVAIVYLAIHRDEYWYWKILCSFLALACPALLVLRQLLQGSLNQAHAERLAALEERDARTRFLASASHDLGQPLQSARLFFDQALRSPHEAVRSKAGVDARTALSAMDRLLRQMLDHLRLEARLVVPDLNPVSAGQLIGQVVSQFDPLAALAEVNLIGASSSLVFRADPDLAARALGNLIDNSLRHADAKRVLVGARRRGDRVRLWVIDDGRGVAPDDVPLLFEDFTQGSHGNGRERGGFGLGLASLTAAVPVDGGHLRPSPQHAPRSRVFH